MKIPMQWISEYAPINVDAAAYQDQMIMIGNGVEGYEEVGGEVEVAVAFGRRRWRRSSGFRARARGI